MGPAVSTTRRRQTASRSRRNRNTTVTPGTTNAWAAYCQHHPAAIALRLGRPGAGAVSTEPLADRHDADCLGKGLDRCGIGIKHHHPHQCRPGNAPWVAAYTRCSTWVPKVMSRKPPLPGWIFQVCRIAVLRAGAAASRSARQAQRIRNRLLHASGSSGSRFDHACRSIT